MKLDKGLIQILQADITDAIKEAEKLPVDQAKPVMRLAGVVAEAVKMVEEIIGEVQDLTTRVDAHTGILSEAVTEKSEIEDLKKRCDGFKAALDVLHVVEEDTAEVSAPGHAVSSIKNSAPRRKLIRRIAGGKGQRA